MLIVMLKHTNTRRIESLLNSYFNFIIVFFFRFLLSFFTRKYVYRLRFFHFHLPQISVSNFLYFSFLCILCVCVMPRHFSTPLMFRYIECENENANKTKKLKTKTNEQTNACEKKVSTQRRRRRRK